MLVTWPMGANSYSTALAHHHSLSQLWFIGGHCLMAFRHLSTLASTVFDTLPRHTRCGIENSATYVGVRQALALVWELPLSCSLKQSIVLKGIVNVLHARSLTRREGACPMDSRPLGCGSP